MAAVVAAATNSRRHLSHGSGGFKRDRDFYSVYQELVEQTTYEKNFYKVEVHGKTLLLTKGACSILREDVPLFGKIRYYAVWLTEWNPFDQCVLFIIFLNCILLALPWSYDTAYQGTWGDQVVSQVNLFTVMFFTIELVLRCVARGLFFGSAPDPPFFREALNWLDLLVVVTSILEVMVLGGDGTRIQGVGFRAFRILRALRTMKILPHLRMIIVSLMESGARLLNWFLVVFLIFITLAVVGNSVFGNVYWRRCRLTPTPMYDANGTVHWPMDPAQTRFCGGRYSCVPSADGAPTYCGSPVEQAFANLVDGKTLRYDVWPEIYDSPETDFGYTGFQTYSAGLLTILQIATMDGWSTLMYRFQDGQGTIPAVLFFAVTVLFCGLLLMNLVLAILWECFDRTSRSAEYTEDVNKKPVPDDIMAMRLVDLVRDVSALELEQAQNQIFKQLDSIQRNLGIKNICYSICTNPWWMLFMDCVIVINAVVLAVDRHPPLNPMVMEILEQINFLCTMAFCVEVVLKLFGHGVDFFNTHFNIFDLVLVIVSIVEFLGLEGDSAVSALRCTRLLRLLKMMKMQMSIRVLLRVLHKATAPTYNFLIVALLTIYCFALLSLQLLAHVDPGEWSELSFHNIGWSYMSIFTLLTTEHWVQNMVAFARVSDHPEVAAAVFISSLVVGHLILIDMLLGIFAVAFAEARDELLDDYRQRLVAFRITPVRRPSIVIADNYDKEVFEEESESEPPSPRFPEDIRRQYPAICEAHNMTIFRMIAIKKAAAIRKAKKGETLTWAPWMPHMAWDPTNFLENVQTEFEAPMTHVESRPSQSQAVAPDFFLSSWSSTHSHGVGIWRSEGLGSRFLTGEESGNPIRRVSFTDTEANAVSETQPMLLSGASHQSAPPDVQMDAPAQVRRTPDGCHSAEIPPQVYGASALDAGFVDVQAVPPPAVRKTPEAAHRAMPPHDFGENDTSSRRAFAVPPVSAAGLYSGSRHEVSDLPRQCTLAGLRRRRAAKIQTLSNPAADFRERFLHAKKLYADNPEDKPCVPCKIAPCLLPRAHMVAEASAKPVDNERCTPKPSMSSAFSPAPPNPTRLTGDDCLARRVERAIEHTARPDSVAGIAEVAPRWDKEVPTLIAARRRCETVGSHAAAPPSEASTVKIFTTTSTAGFEAQAWRIVSHRYFEPVSLALICLSTLMLAMEDPFSDPDATLPKILSILEVVISIAFLAEMLLKLTAVGAWNTWDQAPVGSVPYFRVGWNWIDAIAVAAGVLDMFMTVTTASDNPLKLVRSLRLVRVLRPLRLMRRNKGMRIMVQSLINAIPTLGNMVLIAILFYFGFGILFVNLLKGSLRYCSLDPKGETRMDIVTKDDCLAAGGEWLNSKSNFDHIGNSLITLLHVGTGEGWIEVMLRAASSTGVDLQPRLNDRAHLAFLVIIFVSLTNFFFYNLFVGVLVDQYMVTKAELAGVDVLTAEDRRWAQLQKDMLNLAKFAPRKQDSTLENKSGLEVAATVIQSRVFAGVMGIIVIANTVCVCLASQLADTEDHQTYYHFGSVIFTTIFALEIVVKLLLFREAFTRDPWNVFDFLVVVGATCSIFVDLLPGVQDTDFASFLWIFRAARVFHLAKHLKFTKTLAQVLWDLLLGLANVCGLLALMGFVYACLGMGLFGTIADGAELGPNANFHSFGSAILLLARVATGEGWHLLMFDSAEWQPGCTAQKQSYEELVQLGPRGCGSILGYPYFLTYVIIVKVVLMNLIIGVVLDGFTCVQDMGALKDYRAEFEKFCDKWRQRDPAQRGLIDIYDLIAIVREIPPPIGVGKYHNVDSALFRLRTLPLYRGHTVHLREVVVLLAQRSRLWMMGMYEKELSRARLDPDLLKLWYASFPGVPPVPRRVVVAAQLFIARQFIRVHRQRMEVRRSQQRLSSKPRGLAIFDEDADLEFPVIGGIACETREQQRQREEKQKKMQHEMHQQLLKVQEDLPHLRRPLSPLPWPPRELF